MISVALKNPPSDAYYWRPILFANEVPYFPPNYLLLSERWDLATTGSGYMRLRVVTLRSDMSSLAIRELYNVYIEDDHDYAYNWATNLWEDITAVVGWLKVTERTIAVQRVAVVVGWLKVAERTIAVGRIPAIVGWLKVAERTIVVKVPVPPLPPPPDEAKFPWVPVALIGSGVALAAVAAKGKIKKP